MAQSEKFVDNIWKFATQWCHNDVTTISQQCHNDVTKMSQWYHNDVIKYNAKRYALSDIFDQRNDLLGRTGIIYHIVGCRFGGFLLSKHNSMQ